MKDNPLPLSFKIAICIVSVIALFWLKDLAIEYADYTHFEFIRQTQKMDRL